MLLAYVDDSGDAQSLVLGVISVDDRAWLSVHDALVVFRRNLSRSHGFRMNKELKAGELFGNAGPWRHLNLPTRTRLGIYRAALATLGQLAPAVQTFGVVLPKRTAPGLAAPAAEEAWQIVFQRLESHSRVGATTCFLLPDEGNPRVVRSLSRKHRRFAYAPSAYGTMGLSRPFSQLVDDPAMVNSKTNYLIQWADLVAYAAFRRVIPLASFPDNMWETMGPALLAPVNQILRKRGSSEPVALVIWPDRKMP